MFTSLWFCSQTTQRLSCSHVRQQHKDKKRRRDIMITEWLFTEFIFLTNMSNSLTGLFHPALLRGLWEGYKFKNRDCRKKRSLVKHWKFFLRFLWCFWSVWTLCLHFRIKYDTNMSFLKTRSIHFAWFVQDTNPSRRKLEHQRLCKRGPWNETFKLVKKISGLCLDFLF